MYDWMPSGASPDYLRWHLWVREEHRREAPIRYSLKGKSRELHLPHADIVFDAGKAIFDNKLAAKREMEGYTLMRVGPYYHPNNVLCTHGPYFMTSAHTLRSTAPTFAREGGVKACLDSGGAQIKFGVTGFVSPEKVINLYNKYADVGLALDIPPRIRLAPRREVDHAPATFSLLAAAQKRNNDFFVARKRPDLELLNVAHGLTGDDFRRWITKVDDQDHFAGWATSYDSDQDRYCIWRGVAILVREFGAAEKWLHLFAVSGSTVMPLMAWLGKLIPRLTSDSSSWVQSTKFRNYLFNNQGKLAPLPIGKDFEGHGQDLLAPYCSCPFCQLMKTFGAFRQTSPSSRKSENPDAQTDFTYPALAAHNLIAMKDTVRYWNDKAAKMDFKAFKGEVRKSFPKPKRGADSGASTLHLLDYLTCALSDGPEYADRHVADHPRARAMVSLAS